MLAACSAPVPSPRADCSVDRVQSAESATEVRGLATRCGDNVVVYGQALSKLNRLPPPAGGPQLRLRPAVATAHAQRATLEMDVFFNFLESYPPDIAFEKLATLVERMGTGFAIERVQVTGSFDPEERAASSFDVARYRSLFLRDYLVAAGVGADKIAVTARAPNKPNTPEGRARDRVAEVHVVLWRERATKK